MPRSADRRRPGDARRSASTALELERRRPGSWNKALVSGRPRLRPGRRDSGCWHRRGRSWQLTLAHRPREHLDLDAMALDAGSRVAVAGAGRSAIVLIGAAKVVLAALMFSTTKLSPLKVFSWKSRNSWWNTATFRSMPRPLYFMPSSNASLISGLNSRSAPRSDNALAAGLRRADADRAAARQRRIGEDRRRRSRRNRGRHCDRPPKAERSRLKPPAL